MVDERYKLIHYKFDPADWAFETYGGDEWEFYDHDRDPGEMNNEYDNPEYVGKIRELKAELTRLQTHYRVN